MIKNLFAYVCLLIGCDFLINVVISIVQGNPGEVIMISIIVRSIFFAILFALIGVMVLSLLGKQSLLLALGASSVIVYLLIPVVIYLLKEGSDKCLWTIYLDIHVKPELFIAICLPYILACCASLLILGRWVTGMI